MKISKNILYITEPAASGEWQLYVNKSYTAQIQKGRSDRVYNVPGKKGVVYNILEDSFEPVNDDCYIVTGAAGEKWPISAQALRKYDIRPEDITDEPQEVKTIPNKDAVLAGILIPADIQFTLQVDYGECAELKGNRPGIGHADGDRVLVAAKKTENGYVPDFDDCGRIVNGEIFGILYQPFTEE